MPINTDARGLKTVSPVTGDAAELLNDNTNNVSAALDAVDAAVAGAAKLTDDNTFSGDNTFTEPIKADSGLQANNNKITNVADGSAVRDVVNFGQLDAVQTALDSTNANVTQNVADIDNNVTNIASNTQLAQQAIQGNSTTAGNVSTLTGRVDQTETDIANNTTLAQQAAQNASTAQATANTALQPDDDISGTITIRQDVAATLGNVIADAGELLYSTDSKKLVIGDGTSKFDDLQSIASAGAGFTFRATTTNATPTTMISDTGVGLEIPNNGSGGSQDLGYHGTAFDGIVVGFGLNVTPQVFSIKGVWFENDQGESSQTIAVKDVISQSNVSGLDVNFNFGQFRVTGAPNESMNWTAKIRTTAAVEV